MTNNKPLLVKSIFTNLLFTIGVILLVIGFVNGVSTLTKVLVFDKYPLYSYEESRCDYPQVMPMYNDPSAPIENKESMIYPSPSDQEAEKQKCLVSLDRDRKIKLVNDVTISVSLLFSGIILTAAFRRFIFG